MPVEIRLAKTDQEYLDACRLRYEVYVQEMHRPQPHADHAARMIREPMDEGAEIFVAYDGDRAVGTARSCMGTVRDGFYTGFYHMRCFEPFFPERTAITGKLMVLAEYRGTSLGVRLCKAAYERGLEKRMRFDFIDCNPHLKPLYERLGYKQLFFDADHPEYGRVHLLVLDLLDWFHLKKIRSPFAALLPDDGTCGPKGWRTGEVRPRLASGAGLLAAA